VEKWVQRAEDRMHRAEEWVQQEKERVQRAEMRAHVAEEREERDRWNIWQKRLDEVEGKEQLGWKFNSKPSLLTRPAHPG